jgi:hypothetical protein
MLKFIKKPSFLVVMSSLLMTACATAPKAVVKKEEAPAPSDEVDRDRKSLAEEKGWTIRQFDLNRDEKPDVFKFYGPATEGDSEPMLRKEIDLNHDSRIDVVQIFDASGSKLTEHTDLDFDGRTDEVSHFKDGALVLREIDFNYDGRTDISKKYVKGTLTLIESDRTGDGKVDTWEYFENGSVARIGVDKDADGVVDLWEQDKSAPAAASPAAEAPAEGATDAPAAEGEGEAAAPAEPAAEEAAPAAE